MISPHGLEQVIQLGEVDPDHPRAEPVSGQQAGRDPPANRLFGYAAAYGGISDGPEFARRPNRPRSSGSH
jgi:hypothetical protein